MIIKIIILFTAFFFIIFFLTSCNSNSQLESENAANEVWEVVKAHNKAWSEKEDIVDQMNYVYKDVVFIKPPFKVIMVGKEKYKADYEEWMLRAKVNYFHEINPAIKVYNDGKFAIVSYNIEMSFIYDDIPVNDWKGIDMLTLVNENGRWLITSDMFARETNQTD